VIFYVIANKDSARAYVEALISAGHAAAREPFRADCLLYDIERPGRRREEIKDFLKGHPGFIYPHAPYSFWVWDGCYQPLSVQCNFVVSEAAKEIMHEYGYPYRVESVGFARCAVREFQPKERGRLLFVVPRVLGNRSYADPAIAIEVRRIYATLAQGKTHFESVTVCHVRGNLEILGLSKINEFKYIVTDPRHDLQPTKNMVEIVNRYDVVVAIGTAAYLAIAQGIPTIMYTTHITPRTIGTQVEHFEIYQDRVRYPLDIADLQISNVLDVGKEPNHNVEEWKCANIGKDFDTDTFLSIIREYV